MSNLTSLKYQSTAERKLVRLPLYGNHLSRDYTASKDQRYINLFPETTKNAVTDTKKFFLVKRPGTVLNLEVTATDGEGRGLWYWNGVKYTIIGNKLYADTTVKVTLNSSTGLCGGTTILGEEGEVLFICDGIDGYVVNADGTVENVEKAMPRWVASTIQEVGDKYIPTTLNGYYYTVTIATGEKKTGSSEPTWPTTIGNTVTDGDLTWTCTAAYTGAEIWAGTTAYVVGDLVTPTAENSLYYECTTAGTSSGTEPATWPVIEGDTVTDGTVTWTCKGWYGGFPSPHVPSPAMLNGYVTLAEYNSVDIYNSGVINPFSWSPLDFVSAESFSDEVLALARQNNYIVAFGHMSTEMFYDNANATGSPFSRNESFLLQTGIQAPYAVLQAEKYCMWVGHSEAGKVSVWMLDGFAAKEVSTEYIEKIISAETNWNTVTGYGIRIAGHFFFVLNFQTINKTLVYDLEEGIWHEWQYNGGVFPFCYFSDQAGTVSLLHKSNSTIYTLDENTYTDFDATITCTAITTKYDFDSNKRKFIHKIEVIADTAASDVTVYWSDDDYTTWTTGLSVSLSSRPYIMRGGTTRRRAFKLVHAANTAFRAEFLEIIYTQGNT